MLAGDAAVGYHVHLAAAQLPCLCCCWRSNLQGVHALEQVVKQRLGQPEESMQLRPVLPLALKRIRVLPLLLLFRIWAVLHVQGFPGSVRLLYLLL
jgi:hypothetical protein